MMLLLFELSGSHLNGAVRGGLPPSDRPSQISDSRSFFNPFVTGTAKFERKLSFEEYIIATMTEQLAKN